MSQTWAEFNLKSVDLFADPIYDTYIEKETFLKIYLPLLETLDGRDMTSYIDFFFMRSPVASHIMVFVDEDSKMDFRDYAIEMKLVPSLTEVMEGEDKFEKDLRREKEKKEKEAQKKLQQQRQKEKKEQRIKAAEEAALAFEASPSVAPSLPKKVIKPKPTAMEKRTAAAKKSIDSLMKKLESETDPVIREQINKKIERALTVLNSSF